MPTLSLSFLGPPRVDLEGRPVEVASRKAIALLAYLAITGRSHSREHLAALFWPESDTEHARGALRAALAALRRAIGDAWITAEGDTLSLRSGGREQGAGGREQGAGDRSQGAGDRGQGTGADRLRAGTISLDVARFRAELAVARAHAHALDVACPECQTRLTSAADLYLGDL